MLLRIEHALIFPAPRFPEGNWSPDLGHEEVEFLSEDGVQLHGWYVEPPQPRGVVLYCHGNGDCVGYMSEYLRLLRDELGFAVFAFDYRGYGKSQGRACEDGVLADGRAAWQWLTRRTGRAPGEIILWGRSLGGAVAADLAAQFGARALVLECTFSSMPEVAQRLYPWLPIRWLMRTQFNAADRIAKYSGPVFQFHGGRDSLVPVEIAERLHRAAPGPKHWMLDEQGEHNTPPPPQYYSRLVRFLDSN